MLDTPSEGSISLRSAGPPDDGETAHGASQAPPRFVFQSYHLIDDLTVYENLETPLLYKKIKAAERKALVADALDRFSIVGKKTSSPANSRRTAAAGGHRPSPHHQAEAHPGRRADGNLNSRKAKR